MSYDFPEGYVHPPPPPFTIVGWLTKLWWDFVLWCALDCDIEWVNQWGLNTLSPLRGVTVRA